MTNAENFPSPSGRVRENGAAGASGAFLPHPNPPPLGEGVLRAVTLVLAFLLATTPAMALDKPRDWIPPPLTSIPNHREMTREAVLELANYAKARKKEFVVLMRGGVELVVKGEREAVWEDIQDPNGKDFEKRLPVGAAIRPLVKLLDGIVVDGLYCGQYRFERPLAQEIKERKQLDAELARERKQGIHRQPIPVPVGPFSNDPAEELRKAGEVKAKQALAEQQRRIVYAIDALQSEGRRVLALDDCAAAKDAEASFRNSDRDRVLGFASVGTPRHDQMPKAKPHREDAQPIAAITAARNWLPLLKLDRFGSRDEFVQAIEDSNYDMVVVDVAHRGADSLTKADVYRMKFKKLGPPRLVLAVMPLGRAFDWRWYWQKGWEAGTPPFLFALDDEEPGAFITDIGSPDWKKLLGKYLVGIMDLGFDGVMLDDVGTYLWFEDLMPLDR